MSNREINIIIEQEPIRWEGGSANVREVRETYHSRVEEHILRKLQYQGLPVNSVESREGDLSGLGDVWVYTHIEECIAGAVHKRPEDDRREDTMIRHAIRDALKTIKPGV